MLPIRKLLVPIDFTDACRTTARFAAELAWQIDADVTLLHVLEPYGNDLALESSVMFEQGVRARREYACEQLQRILTSDAGRRIERLLLDGDPATQIVRFAHDERFDLIIMPTRGYGVFRRLLLGSVTAKVLHDAECPVWTGIHPQAFNAEGEIAIRSVACAIDLGPQTRSVLQWASQFADHWGAGLHIVHVVPAMPDPDWLSRLTNMAREQIVALQSELNISADLLLDSGDVRHTVVAGVQQLAPDLLVIGRGHVRSGARLGGTAYAVVRDSLCPVVSV